MNNYRNDNNKMWIHSEKTDSLPASNITVLKIEVYGFKKENVLFNEGIFLFQFIIAKKHLEKLYYLIKAFNITRSIEPEELIFWNEKYKIGNYLEENLFNGNDEITYILIKKTDPSDDWFSVS